VGILFVYFIWLIVKAIHMELLTTILDKVISVGVLALIVVFQQEIRRFLLRLGSRYTREGGRRGLLETFFRQGPEPISRTFWKRSSRHAAVCPREKPGRLWPSNVRPRSVLLPKRGPDRCPGPEPANRKHFFQEQSFA
jgi:hypothetical protein